MPVEGLAGDTEFFTQGCDAGSGLPYRRHGQADLGRGRLERPATLTPSGPGRFQASLRVLRDQLAFKLGQGREDPEDQLALGGGGIHRRPLPDEYLQADLPGGEIMDAIDQMA